MNIRIFEPRIRATMGVVGLQGRWSYSWLQEAGICGHADFLDKELRLSRAYVRANDEGVLLDVISHLCAHALSDHEDHSKEWKATATELGAVTDPTTARYQELLRTECIPKNWRVTEPRRELWVFRSCLASIRRRRSMSVGLR